MAYWDGGWGYYKPKPRIQAKGGIKSQSKRGTFGDTWWAKRWIGVLESFNLGARLTRGRSYARNGSVLSIDIAPGEVKAKVQGSSATPYKISVKLKSLPESDWRKLARALSQQAIFAAKLLAGEMPQEIEAAFKNEQLALFPDKLRDLETDCSCPDWSNPCKHIAAVYYLLGEEFERDPFLIFKLRGMERDKFIQLLGAATPSAAQGTEEVLETLPPEPLSADASLYWQGHSLPPDWLGEARTPPIAAAVLQRLGNFPFWRGAETVSDALRPVYVQASARGLEVLMGNEAER